MDLKNESNPEMWRELATTLETRLQFCDALLAGNSALISGLEARVAEMAEGLHLALDRLKWVSRDSESLGFIRSCQPVIRKIEELLKH